MKWSKLFKVVTAFAVIFGVSYLAVLAQGDPGTAEAEAVIKRAVKNLGGDKYLNVKTQIGRGRFSIIKGGAVVSFQTFVDEIVYPDKERTDFKSGGVKTVQTNVGDTGWVFDGEQELIKIQDKGSSPTARAASDPSPSMTHRLLRVLSAALALVLAGCATHVDLAPDEGQPALRMQQRLALTPSNGGLQITPDDLRAGDIVLSSTPASSRWACA